MSASPDLLRSACQVCNGMLPHEVYTQLFRLALELRIGSVLEIGTAHGAATAAIALGTQQARSQVRIYTVDSFGGRFSSRRAYGSPDDNLNIVRNNFKALGIDSLITVFKGTSDEFCSSSHLPQLISMLMLDADGRIDRDFNYYYELVAKDGIIIIDDVDDNIFLNLNSDGEPYVDLKHRISNLLVSRYEDIGLIKDIEIISNTLFCRSTGVKIDRGVFEKVSLDAYRELVFASGKDYWYDLARIGENASKSLQALYWYEKFEKIPLSLRKPLRNILRRLLR
jgi:predicted O-methyltransferase YrrM